HARCWAFSEALQRWAVAAKMTPPVRYGSYKAIASNACQIRFVDSFVSENLISQALAAHFL
ncbi:MAG: hypothetical protein RR811_10630, partial [Comamonas sp.]